MGLYWSNFSLVFLIHLFLYAGVYCTFRGTPLFPFGTERRKFPYHLLNFPVSSLSSAEKQLREIELQMVSAISFGWFADFGKILTIIQRSSQPVYSDKW